MAFRLVRRASMAFDGRGGCLTRLRNPMGGVYMFLPKCCKRSAVLFGRGDQLPYLPTSPLRRVMMPPPPDESEFGGRAIGIRNKRRRRPKGGGVGVPFWWGSPPAKSGLQTLYRSDRMGVPWGRRWPHIGSKWDHACSLRWGQKLAT